MSSLVADYGTSSESEPESEGQEPEPEEAPPSTTTPTKNAELPLTKLPKPDFAVSSSKHSVFSNPFAEAENAKKAILEKHVKMVPTKDKVDMINGKKICWNYRKGRCHFGHNCTFAHDTDLQTSQEDNEGQTQTSSADSSKSHLKVSQITGSSTGIEENNSLADAEAKWENQSVTRKKRPGLSQGVVPSKKVMKFYKKTKDVK